MPFIPALNCCRVTVNQVYLAQKIKNVFHVRQTAAWTEATMADLGALVIEKWNAHIGPLQSNENQYASVSVRDLTSDTGFGSEYSFPGLSGGDRLGGGMPGNVAVACKLITAQSGKNYRGRLFLAATTEDQFVGNQLTAIAHDQIETNMRSFVQDINAGLGEVVVASFYDGMALKPGPHGQQLWRPVERELAELTAVTNVVVDPFADSMRSRLEGRGN